MGFVMAAGRIALVAACALVGACGDGVSLQPPAFLAGDPEAL